MKRGVVIDFSVIRGKIGDCFETVATLPGVLRPSEDRELTLPARLGKASEGQRTRDGADRGALDFARLFKASGERQLPVFGPSQRPVLLTPWQRHRVDGS